MRIVGNRFLQQGDKAPPPSPPPSSSSSASPHLLDQHDQQDGYDGEDDLAEAVVLILVLARTVGPWTKLIGGLKEPAM